MKWLILIAGLLAAGFIGNKIVEKQDQRAAMPPEQRQQLEANEHNAYNASGIKVFHDDQRNVTCWKYVEYNRGGLSCLPDSQVGRVN